MSDRLVDVVYTLRDPDASESDAWAVGGGLLAVVGGSGRVYSTSAGGDPRAVRVTLRVSADEDLLDALSRAAEEDPDVLSYAEREVRS